MVAAGRLPAAPRGLLGARRAGALAELHGYLDRLARPLELDRHLLARTQRAERDVDVIHALDRLAGHLGDHVAAEDDHAAVALVDRLVVAALDPRNRGGRARLHLLDEHATDRLAPADPEERPAHAAGTL